MPTEEGIPIFERFTQRARRVIILAQEQARLFNHNFLGTEHILLGLAYEEEGVAGFVLRKLGVTPDELHAQIEDRVGSGVGPAGSPPFTPHAKKVLELSLREALQLGHNYIGTEHMLLGLIRDTESVGAQMLIEVGLDPEVVRKEVIQTLCGFVAPPPMVPKQKSETLLELLAELTKLSAKYGGLWTGPAENHLRMAAVEMESLAAFTLLGERRGVA